MKMNYFLILPVLMLFSIPLASAGCQEYSNEYCINGTHRYWEKNICFNNTAYNFNETENCPYSCAGGSCLPSKGADTLSLAVVFAVIIFSFIYLGINISGENALLSWVFIPIGIIFMAVGLFFVAAQSIFSDPINESLAGIMYALIIVMIFLISYFLIYLVFQAMKKVTPYQKPKNQNR